MTELSLKKLEKNQQKKNYIFFGITQKIKLVKTVRNTTASIKQAFTILRAFFKPTTRG